MDTIGILHREGHMQDSAVRFAGLHRHPDGFHQLTLTRPPNLKNLRQMARKGLYAGTFHVHWQEWHFLVMTSGWATWQLMQYFRSIVHLKEQICCLLKATARRIQIVFSFELASREECADVGIQAHSKFLGDAGDICLGRVAGIYFHECLQCPGLVECLEFILAT